MNRMAMDIGSWSPRMLSVLRAMTGLLFLEHGTQKLFGFPPPPNPGPALLSLLGVQGILELVGGFLFWLAFSLGPSPSSSPVTWRSPTS